MNVLLTSVGRRSYMVQYFKEAIGTTGTVHVCNSDSNSVAFRYADRCTVSPLIYDNEYIPFLLDYCKENNIQILISLFDIDLYILAKNKQKFEQIGTKVIVSDPAFIQVCNDKWLTYLFLKEHGFHVPTTYPSLHEVQQALAKGEVQFPIVVKPRFGCGSISVAIAYDTEDLLYLHKAGTREVNKSYLKYESESVSEKMIFQSCLQGQEYGADIINDLQGKHRATVLRKKIAMRSGETDIAELVDIPQINAELDRLGSVTGHIGNLDCDIFLVDEIPYILEMNARFGGGYPFSHMAGCDLPRAIVAWCLDEPCKDEYFQVRIGTKGFKEIHITED